MNYIMHFFLLLSLGLFAGDEGILPKQLTVDLPKNCQMLMLHATPDRESRKTFTTASNGDKVENMGCVREITQKELDALPKAKRYYIAWKHPVWCRVAFGKKQGWVMQQHLKNEDLKVDEDF